MPDEINEDIEWLTKNRELIGLHKDARELNEMLLKLGKEEKFSPNSFVFSAPIKSDASTLQAELEDIYESTKQSSSPSKKALHIGSEAFYGADVLNWICDGQSKYTVRTKPQDALDNVMCIQSLYPLADEGYPVLHDFVTTHAKELASCKSQSEALAFPIIKACITSVITLP